MVKCSSQKEETCLIETLLQWAYRGAWSDTDTKLLPYKGVVDVLWNVVKGLSIIRAGTRGRHRAGFCEKGLSSIRSDVYLFSIKPAVESCGAALKEGIYWCTDGGQHQDDLGGMVTISFSLLVLFGWRSTIVKRENSDFNSKNTHPCIITNPCENHVGSIIAVKTCL